MIDIPDGTEAGHNHEEYVDPSHNPTKDSTANQPID